MPMKKKHADIPQLLKRYEGKEVNKMERKQEDVDEGDDWLAGLYVEDADVKDLLGEDDDL
jgi:hypothetical protein